MDLKVPPEGLADEPPVAGVGPAAVLVVAALAMTTELAPMKAPMAPPANAPVPVILITYATTEDAVRKALAAVSRDKVISGKPQVIRIEKN